MLVIQEMTEQDFDFWAGAKDRVESLTSQQLKAVWETLEEVYTEGMTATEVNDFFWFEEETIAEWLGFDSWEELEEANKEDK